MFIGVFMLLTTYLKAKIFYVANMLLVFQFSYEKPIYKWKRPSCCKFLPFPCWWHCLKSVQIETLRGYAYTRISNGYLLENTEILGVVS